MSGIIFRSCSSIKMYDQTFGRLVGCFKDSSHFCGSTLQVGSLSTAASSSDLFFNHEGTHVGKANGINMKRCCIRLWHLSKLLSPREHTHPPVGCLKRAIDSSKKSQIKTSTNCGGKKTAPPQSNVKRLATWKQEVVQRVVRKKDEV